MEQQNQLDGQIIEELEPDNVSDNSLSQIEPQPEVSKANEGQSDDPSELILGKFKSTEDLIKAYQELEKLQGTQSAELGSLRENTLAFNNVKEAWKALSDVKNAEKELKEVSQKYSDYFRDPSFREIYKNAYLALGKNLDTDRFINLLEGYASARIFSHEKDRAKSVETENSINNLSFDKSEKTVSKPKIKKRVEDMNPKEYEEFLQKLI